MCPFELCNSSLINNLRMLNMLIINTVPRMNICEFICYSSRSVFVLCLLLVLRRRGCRVRCIKFSRLNKSCRSNFIFTRLQITASLYVMSIYRPHMKHLHPHAMNSSKTPYPGASYHCAELHHHRFRRQCVSITAIAEIVLVTDGALTPRDTPIRRTCI